MAELTNEEAREKAVSVAKAAIDELLLASNLTTAQKYLLAEVSGRIGFLAGMCEGYQLRIKNGGDPDGGAM